MEYFRDSSGAVYAYRDTATQQRLRPDLTPMTPEEIEAHLHPEPVVIVPQSVTMRQARLALLGADLLDGVNSAISGLSGPQGAAARIEWEYAQTVERDSQLVQSLASELALTEQQLDDLFTEAAAL